MWPGKSLLRFVVVPHREGIAIGRGLREMGRPPHEAIQRKRSLRSFGAVEGEVDDRL